MNSNRSLELLKNCMTWMSNQEEEVQMLYNVFAACGISDEELKSLGFGYVIMEEDEEEW